MTPHYSPSSLFSHVFSLSSSPETPLLVHSTLLVSLLPLFPLAPFSVWILVDPIPFLVAPSHPFFERAIGMLALPLLFVNL